MTSTLPTPVRETAARRAAVTRLAIAAVVCGIVLVALAAVFVRTRPGQRLDNAALEGRVVQSPRAAAQSDEILRTISVGSLAFFGAAIMGVAAVRGRWLLAFAAGAVIGGSNATTQVLKAMVERPSLIPDPAIIDINTLPSGHSTVAASLAAALILVVPVRMRPLAAAVGGMYAAGIAAMTLAAGWHRPSDAVAAFAVVGVWTFGLCAVLVAARGTGRPRVSAGLPGLVIAGVLVLVVAFVAVVATTTITRADGVHIVRIGLAYVAGLASIVAVGVAFVVAEVLALRGVSLDAPPRGGSAWT